MKVAIYPTPLTNRPVGIENYTINLINSLVKLNGKNRYYLIGREKSSLFTDIEQIIIKNPFKLISRTYYWYPYSTIAIKKLEYLDIVHNLSQLPTFFKTRQKSIITVHDITYFILPREHKTDRSLIYKLLLPTTLSNTDRIIVDSIRTGDDLSKHLDIPREKIDLVYPGVDHKRYRPLPENEKQHIKAVYRIDSPFILYVGTLEPRKNIPTLVEAFYKLKSNIEKYKLVIAGKKGWKYKEIFETVERLNLQNQVLFTGYIPEQDLPGLYNIADLFVYPSIYEGFGLPPLEAMACGTPVITSNTSSLPEVVGDAGVMVNPHDVDGLAKAMYDVLTNKALSEEMIHKGIERAKLFTWEKCAGETLRVYEELSSGLK